MTAPAGTRLPTPGPETGTGWFVYGVTRSSLAVPETLRGVDDQPVRLLPRGDIAAVASTALLDRPPGRRAEILAYTGVLDALAMAGPVAPVRFGSIFADDRDVAEQLLAPSGDEFGTLLDDLAGRVQLRLIATYREDAVLAEVVASDPEIGRLHELTRDAPADALYAERVALGRLVAATMDGLRADDAAAILGRVRSHCVALMERPGGGLGRAFSAQLLVDAERVPDVEQLLEEIAADVHDRLALRLLGPMAAYDFVGGTPWD